MAKIRIILTFAVAFFFQYIHQYAFCEEILLSESSKAKEEKSFLPENFSLDLGMYYQTDFNPRGYSKHDPHFGLSLSPSYKLPQDFLLSGDLSLEKQLTKEEATDLSELVVALKKKILKIDDNTSVGLTFTGQLPLSEETKKESSIRGGFSAGTGVTRKLKDLGLKGTAISYTLSAGRLFHEYTTNAKGDSNTRLKIIQGLSLSHSYRKKLSVSGVFKYTRSYNYESQRLRDKYSFDFTTDYKLDEKLSGVIEYSLGGNAARPNGIGSAIDLYDSELSSISFTFKYHI